MDGNKGLARRFGDDALKLKGADAVTGQDIAIIAEAVGWPLALLVAILVVLAKSGWLKIILRDDRREEIDKLASDLADLKKIVTEGFTDLRGQCKGLRADIRAHDRRMDETADKIAAIDKGFAVLKDRWDRYGD